MKKLLFIIIAICLFSISCKQEKKTQSPSKETAKQIEKKYKLTPFAQSQNYTDAVLNEMSFRNGQFNFEVKEGNYKLGAQTPDASQKMCANSKKGQHLHLIVDNEPYAAKYTDNFNYKIDDGEHHILAFLSRSYHESIKSKGAHIAKKVSIKNNNIEEAVPIKDPFLFYSRPKGTYVGKKNTEKVMLDFFPINVKIGKTHKVIALINGEEHHITKWQPYYISGLPIGENTVELTLVTMDNQKVVAPYNPITRKFVLLENNDPTV